MEKKASASAAGDFPCANVGCKVTGRDKVNQRCAGCGAVWYCGRRCQKRHWRQSGGNHKSLILQTGAAEARGGRSS